LNRVEVQRYLRTESALWRDTGRHVLVLNAAQEGGLIVLAGQEAALWRLLAQRLSTPEILSSLVEGEETELDEGDVLDAVETLVESGLVHVEGRGSQ
jgi:hypothetical protein